MPDKEWRFVIDVGGTKRELFSAIEKQKKGDVILVLKSSFSIGRSFDDPLGQEIKEQRISIHPSVESPTFNTVKQLLALKNGLTRTMALLTKGPKAGRFGSVIERRSADLSNERYLLSERRSKNAGIVNIGAYDPDLHTLFWGVYVGRADVLFQASPVNDVSIHQQIMLGFRIVVLSSVSEFPSHNSNGTCNFFTVPLDRHPHAAEAISNTMEAFDPIDCIHFHRICKSHLTRDFITQVSPRDQKTAELLDRASREASQSPILMGTSPDVIETAVQLGYANQGKRDDP